jgi:hypothetical protein
MRKRRKRRRRRRTRSHGGHRWSPLAERELFFFRCLKNLHYPTGGQAQEVPTQ